ncbi:hypothetical protein DFP94_10988 [Fontibacillus phaseoli]|uniref:Uncharacterized protein n=1 Tax=Fontibacillus phaseoli TaxID=1416533 RepID=A0A369BCG8_9BACL|nr:hypothetical protein [Fontibacillus phaseoli]RCX17364.1 hypothetical protein DFP94_10988 [Fontibacillus phaseoli]
MDNQIERNKKEDLGYLFNVEILVRNETNAKALQSLLTLLNSGEHIIDYRINSGIELGEIIESLLTAKKQSIISKSYKRLTATEQTKKTPDAQPAKAKAPAQEPASKTQQGTFEEIAKSGEFEKWIKTYIAENRLVRLLVNHNGKRTSIPCRVLNFLPETYTLSVYHVDEKQVYTFNLSEIIDFIDKK